MMIFHSISFLWYGKKEVPKMDVKVVGKTTITVQENQFIRKSMYAIFLNP